MNKVKASKKKKKIKSSKISLARANAGKRSRLDCFIIDYQTAVSRYVDFLWNNDIQYIVKNVTKYFSISKNLLDLPLFLADEVCPLESNLSKRALKCAFTQAIGIVKAHISEKKKLLYVLTKLRSEGKRARHIKKRLDKIKLVKPNVDAVWPELNSICANYEDSIESSAADSGASVAAFDGWLTLASIGKLYGKIILPIQHMRHSRALEKKGKLKPSFQISNRFAYFRYEINVPKLKTEGGTVGADQGIVTCVTLSNGVTTRPCPHGHDLRSITQKIARKQKGSRAFRRAKAHQENYINWSINQLNLSNIKVLKLEKISNFRVGKNVGKFLNHMNETLIRSKLTDCCSAAGVQLVEQHAAYRSQRCSACGYVCRGNRKGKLFSCKRCGYTADADYNASCNHEQDLPSAGCLLHRPGGAGPPWHPPKEFYWLPKGFYNLDGSELGVPSGHLATVPDSPKI